MDYVNSYYAATAARMPACAPLRGTVQTDVCIVGGGFTGLNTAIELADRGYAVTLLEARRIGWGCSGRNGGQFIGGMAAYDRLHRQLGESGARLAWQMGVDAIDVLRRRIDRFAIDCDLKTGYLDAAVNARQMRELRQSVERQRDFGYPHALKEYGADTLHEVIGSRAYVGGVTDEGCGHLHPLNLCLGEARAARELGVVVHEGSPVLRIEPGARTRVHCAGGTVEARFAVIAGNAYLDGMVPQLRGLALPAASWIIATEPLSPELSRELLPGDHAVCDQNTLLDYYRLSADRRLLFGGRCNYTGRVPRDVKATLMPRMLRVFPQLRGVRIDYEWGGTVAVSLLRIPQFGRIGGNVFYAQGYSGHGIVPTHMAGCLLAEVIAGSAERFDLFARIRHRRLPGGKWVASPALALGMMYYRLRDLL